MASAPGRSHAPFLSIPPSRPTRGPPPHARGQVPGTRRPSWSLISLVGVNRGVPGGGAPRAELPTRRGCLLSPLKSHCAEIGAFPVAAASPPPAALAPPAPHGTAAARLPGGPARPRAPGAERLPVWGYAVRSCTQNAFHQHRASGLAVWAPAGAPRACLSDGGRLPWAPASRQAVAGQATVLPPSCRLVGPPPVAT